MLRGDDKPCPDTPTRIAHHSSTRRDSPSNPSPPKATTFTPPTPGSSGAVVLDKDSPYIKAPHLVRAEDNRMFKSLKFVITGADSAPALLDDDKGGGKALYALLG